MSDGKKWTRRAALGFIGTGFGLFALNTGAATQIYSDRNVSFGTADDDDALLPLSDESGNANISGSSDEAVIYEIGQNQNGLNWEFTNATVLNVSTSTGSDRNPGITVSGEDKTINIGCDSSDEFEGDYRITLRLTAEVSGENGPLSVTTEQKTQEISIDCRSFYSIDSNYSDTGSGDAAQPGDSAKGIVTHPGNIGEDNGDVAIIEDPEQGSEQGSEQGGGGGQGSNISLLVGFVLPPVEPADCYTLTVRTADGGGGNLQAYLSDGTELGGKKQIEGNGGNDFDDNDETEITQDTNDIGSADPLYLIFEGRGNQTHEIDFIQLESGCS